MPSQDDGFNPDVTSSSSTVVTFDQLAQSNFDPVQYLNETLPVLNINTQSTPTPRSHGRTSLLQNVSTDVQGHLAQLGAHHVRTSSELMTLTDEILRSGNRLAYEVEVLRGNANNLHETLAETLKEDIALFVKELSQQEPENGLEDAAIAETKPSEPDFIQQLRTLGLVKTRLESVINVFGEALTWPIPPSEVSGANLISVSAPELGVASSEEDDKAREYTRQLRGEIAELLNGDGQGYTGVEAAVERVERLRNLTLVWRGTSEERARTKVVDGLAKMVEDKRRTLDTKAAQLRPTASTQRNNSMPGRAAARIGEGASNTASGLFRGLQKLRDEIYLD